jgi:hypothetical protein
MREGFAFLSFSPPAGARADWQCWLDLGKKYVGKNTSEVQNLFSENR